MVFASLGNDCWVWNWSPIRWIDVELFKKLNCFPKCLYYLYPPLGRREGGGCSFPCPRWQAALLGMCWHLTSALISLWQECWAPFLPFALSPLFFSVTLASYPTDLSTDLRRITLKPRCFQVTREACHTALKRYQVLGHGSTQACDPSTFKAKAGGYWICDLFRWATQRNVDSGRYHNKQKW